MLKKKEEEKKWYVTHLAVAGYLYNSIFDISPERP